MRADFETIIDSPPAEFSAYDTINSNTQLNLYPGGVLPASTNIGPARQPGDKIEINLLGGTIGSEERSFYTLSNSSRRRSTSNFTINLIEGKVWGDVEGTGGALITLSGATLNGDLRVTDRSLAVVSSGATLNGSMRVTDGSLAVVSGGQIANSLYASDGSMVQMSGGTIGSSPGSYFDGVGAYDGSVFLMSGGVIHGKFVISNSYTSLTGGRIDGVLAVSSSGQLEIAGGTHGPIHAYDGGVAALVGGEFQLDGIAIDGFNANSQSIDFPTGSVLTGVLSDGSPVTLARSNSILHDYFQDDRITLRQAPVPASEPRAFDAPGDAIPAGLRTGQSLTLRPDAFAPANFTALPGSSVSIVGGSIDRGFEATGALMTLSTGSIGERAAIYRGTTLQVLGGTIGSNFEAGAGSRLEVSGGTIDVAFVAHPDSEVIYSGGKFAPSFGTKPGSSFTVAGGDFRLNGARITSLATTGDVQQIDLPESGVLSGTLSDGTPFAFSSDMQWFAPGSLALQVTDVPTAGPAIIRLPSDPVPPGLRSGQTLLLTEGGELGDHFTADWGSIVRMSGGHIGYRFQAVGSFVNVNGGTIDSMDALFGSVVNIDGGSVNHRVSAYRGAIVNLSAGEVAGGMHAHSGGRVNISGGSVGGYSYVGSGSAMSISGGVVTRDISLYGNSLLTLRGGETHGKISVEGNSRIDIRGGQLGDGLFVGEGGHATLRGSDFRIDGEPIAEDLRGRITAVDLPSGAVLSGVYSDRTPFAFTSSDGDWFSPGTLQVSSSFFIPLLTPFPSLRPSNTPPRGLLPGDELTLETGENVGANFTAGWGSELTVAGGEIGENFEAVGAQVNLLEGIIGENMDVMFGSVVNVTGGTIGYGFEAHRGSLVNISGGNVQEVTARSGSTLNISGGTLGSYSDGEYHSGNISLEAGSELYVTGTDFLLNGNSIDGLEPGTSVVLALDDKTLFNLSLNATLLDGSPFAAYLSNYSGSIPHGWQFDGPFAITLTAALPGDFDGNQLVDAADLEIWQTQFGENAYGSTLRNGSDFLNWQRTLGAEASNLANAQIPEPASWQTITVMIAVVLLRVQRIRRL